MRCATAVAGILVSLFLCAESVRAETPLVVLTGVRLECQGFMPVLGGAICIDVQGTLPNLTILAGGVGISSETKLLPRLETGPESYEGNTVLRVGPLSEARRGELVSHLSAARIGIQHDCNPDEIDPWGWPRSRLVLSWFGRNGRTRIIQLTPLVSNPCSPEMVELVQFLLDLQDEIPLVE